MIKKIIPWYIKACSSALLYSAAFIWLDYCWFLVLPALGIIGWFFYTDGLSRQSTYQLKFFILWNVLVVCAHYMWIIPSLQNKLGVPLWCASGMYGVVSAVHAACFALFWWGVFRLPQSFFLYKVTPYIFYRHCYLISLLKGFFGAVEFVLSFPFAGFMIAFIFGSEGCYNMISPLIPLSKIFVDSGVKIDCESKIMTIWNDGSGVTKNISFFSLANQLPNTTPPWGLAQHLFHALNNLEQALSIVVTPESFFPFPLNRYPEMITFIAHALKPRQMLFLGSQHAQDPNKIFQAVYMITHKGVEYVYLKQHAVPFFEQMPWYLKNVKKLNYIFNAEQSFSCAPKNIDFCGILHDGRRIVPRLCSDFFLVTTVMDLAKLRHRYGDRLLVILQVNDTWFIGYMRTLLRQVACMRAWMAGVDLVYVGYRYR